METASISANKARLQYLEMNGDERAREILSMIRNIQHTIAVVLVGNNICLVVGSLIGRKFFAQFFPVSAHTYYWGSISSKEIMDILILTPLFLIFAEILPKQIFRHKADRLILILGRPLKFFAVLFLPILHLLDTLTMTVLAPVGIRRAPRPISFTKDDLLRLLATDSTEKRVDDKSLEREMIRKVCGLEKTLTREVMKPINDVVSIRLGKETIKSVIELARTTGYSRFPVYKDKVIHLLGYVDIYQILRSDLIDKRLEDFVHSAYYVPETKPIDDLLQQFLKRGERVAIVVDEFGACSGWITIEDILEEIVGEIQDEFDQYSIDIVREDDNVFVMEAHIDIDDLNERLGLNLPKEGYETLAGFVYTRLGEIPSVGDSFESDNIKVEVLSMTGPRIDRVRLTIQPTPEPADN
ncbi:HlyC/CorC family transporter [Candidatus Sumerlaeota bacterium]|nr:HlyC/CorC family transporter [Candidatus Sumerlaeota bacterium]